MTKGLLHCKINSMWNKHLSRLPDRDKLSVLIVVILLGLAITQFIQLPSQQVGTTVLGSRLGLEISGYWMIVSVLVIVASTGTDMLIRSRPRRGDGQEDQSTFVAWIVPGLTVLVAARILAATPSWPLWLMGLIITGITFGAVVTAEYLLVDAKLGAGSRARLLLNVVAYILILSLYAIIYQTRSRSLITVSATGVASFLIALHLLYAAQAGLKRTALLAGIISIILGECSWALNYCRVSMWSGSLFLLLVFYTSSGLATQHLKGKLTPQLLVEFAGVALIGIGLLITFRP